MIRLIPYLSAREINPCQRETFFNHKKELRPENIYLINLIPTQINHCKFNCATQTDSTSHLDFIADKKTASCDKSKLTKLMY